MYIFVVNKSRDCLEVEEYFVREIFILNKRFFLKNNSRMELFVYLTTRNFILFILFMKRCGFFFFFSELIEKFAIICKFSAVLMYI